MGVRIPVGSMAKRIKQLDLAAPEVIEAIATYLVDKPKAEANKLKETINNDRSRIKYQRTTLKNVRERLNADPFTVEAERQFNKRRSELKQKLNDLYYDDVDYDCDAIKKLEQQIASLDGDKANHIGRLAKKLKKENPSLSESPFDTLYASQKEEVEELLQQLDLLDEHLKEQMASVSTSMAPLERLSEDLSEYLSIANNIRSIREARSFVSKTLTDAERRQHAIGILAHYSQMAIEGLTEVKNTLDSGVLARRELISATESVAILGA